MLFTSILKFWKSLGFVSTKTASWSCSALTCCFASSSASRIGRDLPSSCTSTDLHEIAAERAGVSPSLIHSPNIPREDPFAGHSTFVGLRGRGTKRKVHNDCLGRCIQFLWVSCHMGAIAAGQQMTRAYRALCPISAGAYSNRCRNMHAVTYSGFQGGILQGQLHLYWMPICRRQAFYIRWTSGHCSII